MSLGKVDGNPRVCITGHSLGGALAVLAAHDIHREFQLINMQAGCLLLAVCRRAQCIGFVLQLTKQMLLVVPLIN